MFAADEENSDKIIATAFDLNRLEELNVNGRLESETGTWTAIKEQKDITFIENVSRMRIFSFRNVNQLKEYLKKQ